MGCPQAKPGKKTAPPQSAQLECSIKLSHSSLGSSIPIPTRRCNILSAVIAVAVVSALLLLANRPNYSLMSRSNWADAGILLMNESLSDVASTVRRSLTATVEDALAHVLVENASIRDNIRGTVVADDEDTVDGVWELPSTIGSFAEGAVGGITLEKAGSLSYVRDRLRHREYARLGTTDVPWMSVIYNDPAIYYPKCTPDMHSCTCNQELTNTSTCARVAHRQKPVLYIAAEVYREGVYDCPTVRCIVSAPQNYSARDRAYVSFLVFYSRKSVLARFPSKIDPLWNMNVLKSLEPAGRYWRLDQQSFHRGYGVDYHLTHRPNGNISHIPLSYAEHQSINAYRRAGASFPERSNRTIFFNSNCARWRQALLSNTSSYMELHSFGRCDFGQAKKTDVARDWPKCSHPELGGGRKNQKRNFVEKQCILGKSRVSIIVENSRESGYMSEKIYHAIVQGNVPVYQGAPDVKQYLPKDAAIHVDDFPSVEALMKYVLEVNNDEALWLKHTAWKMSPFRRNFTNLLMRGSFSPCTVCETFADDATPIVNVTSPASVTPKCLGEVFDHALGAKHSIPVLKPLSPSGVDAIFILQGPSSARLSADFKRIWNEETILVTALSNVSISAVEAKCLLKVDKACRLFRCSERNGEDACAQSLFAEWLQVRYALANVLVVRGGATIIESEAGRKWEEVLGSLPVDFEVTPVGRAGEMELPCSSGHLISQAGARKLLNSGWMTIADGRGATSGLLSIGVFSETSL